MKAFKLRLELAVGSGAALALLSVPACGSNSAERAPAAAGATGQTNQSLEPYPVEGLGCSGPSHDAGYHGQCCAEALCYTPTNGSECVAPNDAPSKLGKSYGSGLCLCGGGIEGPFAANPAYDAEQPGTCCYVVRAIGCDGRPMLVAGTPIISPLMARRDWLVVDLLELS